MSVNGLGEVQNDANNSFQILNKKNVTYLLTPSSCDEDTQLLLMISSGHDNHKARAQWRKRISNLDQRVRHVFLVSLCDTCTHDLTREHDTYHDIVHTSLLDGHRRLGYKILSGYIWSYLNCHQAKYVAKTDDNVVIDLPRLIATVSSKSPDDKKVMCGCGPPHRNMKTLRSETPRMLGNWSVPKDQLESDIVPDFCAGFMYLVTPRLASKLAQAGFKVFGDHNDEIVLIEDSLITGVLRESLGDVDLEILVESSLSLVWTRFFSHCPWMTVAKMTFFDELVLSKISDRSGVQYVGDIWTPGNYYSSTFLKLAC